MEAVRKGDGADGQRAKVMGNFTTEDEGEESSIVSLLRVKVRRNAAFPSELLVLL